MGYTSVSGKLVEATQENPSRRKPHSWWAGYASECKNHTSGDYNVVVKAEEQHLDTGGGPWAAICNAHSTLMNFTSFKLARDFSKDAQNWCDYCRVMAGTQERGDYMEDADLRFGSRRKYWEPLLRAAIEATGPGAA